MRSRSRVDLHKRLFGVTFQVVAVIVISLQKLPKQATFYCPLYMATKISRLKSLEYPEDMILDTYNHKSHILVSTFSDLVHTRAQSFFWDPLVSFNLSIVRKWGCDIFACP